uniref:Orn/DAP/Arg decarboxylase 2 C-terminal domain-containing protein n=4 Tax=Photinus pyralis TaxID=7054 RepID=A0A1Y1LYN6_PHOPY
MYPLKIPSHKELYSSTIFGVTCGAKDKLIENLTLPSLEIDDWLILKNMGAYSLGLHTSMNGFFVPRMFYVTDFNNLTRYGLSEFNYKFTKTILKEATDDRTNLNEEFRVTFCLDFIL